MEGAKSFITCPLCSSRYSETGAHVPRMLPCTHTVCGMCIGQEIKRETCLVCRECGKKHEIPNDGKTFPPNNYILGMLQLFGQQSTPETTTQRQQSQAQIKEREGIEFKQCPEHTRELSLYCKSEGCGKDICQLCMLENHKSHEVVDIKREMTQRLDALTKELAKSKEEMRMIKENLASNFDQSLQQLEERKVLFETMIKESTHCFQNVNKEIDEKMKEIEDQILKVNKMKENGTSLGGVEVAERLLRGKKLIYQYSKYNGVPISECGKLVNEYFSTISHQVTSTFKVPGISFSVHHV